VDHPVDSARPTSLIVYLALYASAMLTASHTQNLRVRGHWTNVRSRGKPDTPDCGNDSGADIRIEGT